MKLKQLEGLLGGLTQFSNPKVELEQYATGPHIASRMLYTAENSFGDITGKVVADFGCGCGTLAVASALLDAEHVTGIDIDLQSLELAQENADDLEVCHCLGFFYNCCFSLKLDIDLIQCDIKNLNLKGLLVDTVVMNPPFGTKRNGADMEFLSMGLKAASQAVYSLHKTSTREYIKKAALRNCNALSAEVLCELRYDLPQTYEFHKKKEVDVAVDLWRFVPRARDESTAERHGNKMRP
ncbi:methyltransferase-like protein 5 isoform X1 [Brachypodium distachyon]|uniref:methyltransferase-like protein 5 isoform X1 n=1 Tax=Brachypodium distachyon TaxID=15368 RepID=UPI000D0D13C0|nr:methyltransferase-like protein 5 isoform X1 [Brachypodium distachyon]|eukprot:XP_024312916.1 methyltransferase-like protein 5 isoform X1 [Brachypodium distachyon]